MSHSLTANTPLSGEAYPETAHRFAALALGIVGILMAGLQPLLLGLLAGEGRLSAAQIGHAATAELLAMGAAASLAGTLLAPTRLRTIAALACLALAGANLLSVRVDGEMLTLVRALAGVPGGILIWIAIGLIVRTPLPERWSGIYLTAQTLAQFMVAALLATFVIPGFGANGSFITIAALCVVAIPLVLWLPNHYAPLTRSEASETARGLPTAHGMAALLAAFLFLAFISGIWSYAEPLSRQSGHAAWVIGTAVPLSLASQVAGGLAATFLASRFRWSLMLIICGLTGLALIAGFALLPPALPFLLLSAVFGFIWLFVLPFIVAMALDVDRSHRAALLLGGAQLVGASAGPLAVSLLVTDTEIRGTLVFGALTLAGFLAIVLLLARTTAKAGEP